MKNIQVGRFSRVSKPCARKIYESGGAICVCAWKENPERDGVYDMKKTIDGEFDQMVSEFIYYNCSSRERGYYPAFYIREGE